MRVAIYPGSFNPWHAGHQDIYEKALQLFDKVIIAIADNPQKPKRTIQSDCLFPDGAQIESFEGLLANYVNSHQEKPVAIIRGLRNSADLEYERMQQYWNEDLGLKIPVTFFITDRSVVHVSSSAIRSIAEISCGRSKCFKYTSKSSSPTGPSGSPS